MNHFGLSDSRVTNTSPGTGTMTCLRSDSHIDSRRDEEAIGANMLGTRLQDAEFQQAAVQKVLREGHGRMRLPFTYKLHILLEDMEEAGSEHIISWGKSHPGFFVYAFGNTKR